MRLRCVARVAQAVADEQPPPKKDAAVEAPLRSSVSSESRARVGVVAGAAAVAAPGSGVPVAGSGDAVPAYAAALGLDAPAVAAYDALWAEARDGASGDVLPAAGAVKFLGTSGLPTPELGRIWALACEGAVR